MSTATLSPAADQAREGDTPRPGRSSAFGWAQLVRALPGALRKLNPAALWRNPVMFLVWMGAALTTVIAVVEPFTGGADASGGTPVPLGFTAGIAAWLWLTVLFANLAEAVAEGRGKAQADTLRKTKRETVARRLVNWRPGQPDPAEEQVPGTQLTLGDHVVVEAGQVIPGDGDVVEGVASVDESAITGESAPVIR